MTFPSVDPWRPPEAGFPEEGSDADKLRFAASYAVLAPSSHNSQPWLFRLRGGALELLADRSRALPVVDPHDRELVISCGAALSHLRVALRRFGHEAATEILPELTHHDLLARVRPGARVEPTEDELALFAAIPARRTTRRPFRDRQVPAELVEALRRAADEEGAWLHVLRGDDERAQLAELVTEGDLIQAADSRFRRELAAWIHPNRSRSRDGLPGYALGAGDLASYMGPLVIRTFDWGDGQAARDRQLVEGSPVLAVLGTPREDPASWIAAGQALGRVLLRACADGVTASYLNQPVEVPELRERMRAELCPPGYPQLVLRMGYGDAVHATPRRPAQDVIVEG